GKPGDVDTVTGDFEKRHGSRRGLRCAEQHARTIAECAGVEQLELTATSRIPCVMMSADERRCAPFLQSTTQGVTIRQHFSRPAATLRNPVKREMPEHDPMPRG